MIGPSRPEISIVVPVFNEEDNLDHLFERLFPVLDGLDSTFEVIAIDDGSSDRSLEILERQKSARPELEIVRLARNFGQHPAVLAGLVHSRGGLVVTMDADLQNPPEEIPQIVSAMRAGHDLVNTSRKDRHDSLFRRMASAANCWLTRRLSGVTLEDFGSMLRGYDRSVVDALTSHMEFRAFVPALGMIYARNPTEIPIRHEARAGGRSKYSLLKLLGLQLDLTTTFSLVPLRALFLVGVLIALCSVGFGMLLLALRLWLGSAWAGEGVFTLFAIVFFLLGMQFVAFGILGEYIGRIYQEVRRRPPYLLHEETCGRAPRAGPSIERDPPADPAGRRSGEERSVESRLT